MKYKYQKRYTFGFGTILSLIIVYFIFLYARDKGWTLLAFIAKWYLIISLAIIGFFVGILVLILLLSLFAFLMAYIKTKSFKKKKKKKDYIDAEYEIKG